MALTAQYATSWESAVLPSFITGSVVGGNAGGRDGVGLRTAATNSTTLTLTAGVLSNTRGALSLWFKPTSVFAGGGINIGFGATGTQLNINCTPAALTIQAGASVLATTAGSFVGSAWNCFAIIWDISGGTKNITVWLNGLPLAYSGSATITTMPDSIKMNTNQGGGDVALDDLWVGVFDAAPASSDIKFISGRAPSLVANGDIQQWYGINGAATALAGLTGTGQAACNILNGEGDFTITGSGSLSITPSAYYGLNQYLTGCKKSAATPSTRILGIGRRVGGATTVDSSLTLSSVAQTKYVNYLPLTTPALADYNNTQVALQNN